MKLFIRTVDLERDRPTLLDLLNRNLRDLDHAARFDWIYLENPAGRAWSWFVCDADTEQAVGVATVFPRFFWIDGSVERCGQVGDFAVDVAYRSLGPALRLQRATLEHVDRGVLRFCYDCPPHERGMATFHRLRLTPVCRMARFAEILKADQIIRQRLPGGQLVHVPVSLLANTILRLRDAMRHNPVDLLLGVQEGAFGTEFDELDQTLGAPEGVVRARRAAEDLNWRYRADPLVTYRVHTARRDERLCGFAIVSETEDRAKIVELRGTTEPARLALLRGVSEAALRRGIAAIETYCIEPSSEALTAIKAGFVRREFAQRVVVYGAGGGDGTLDGKPMKWAFDGADTVA